MYVCRAIRIYDISSVAFYSILYNKYIFFY